VDNFIQRREVHVVKGSGPDEFPDLLNGIHFRRVGRDEKEANIIGYNEGVGFMPCRAIAAEQDFVLGKLGGELL